MEIPDLIDQVAEHGAGMADAISRADPEAQVLSVPDWTVRDLARHMGDVHRWATGIVAGARKTNWDASREEIVGEWPSDDQLGAWLRDGVDVLVDTLRSAPDDLDCWTFKAARSPKHFWARRQAHEAAIHRVDAELVVGGEVGFDSTFAADGLDELLVETLPQPHRKIRSDRAVSLRFEPTDTTAWWRCEMGPDGFTTTTGSAPADCTVRGSASDLYAFSWNRLSRDRLEVTGDGEVIDVWRAVATA